jgi:hypothetical protein
VKSICQSKKKILSSPCAQLIKHRAMETCRSGGIAPLLLTSTLSGGEWSASRPCRFTPWYLSDRRLDGPQCRYGRCE